MDVYKSRVERGINCENYQPKYDRIIDLITQQRRKLFRLEPVENPTEKLLDKTKEYKRSKRVYTELEEKQREITNKIMELYKSIINVNFTGEIDTSIPQIKNELLQVVNNWQVNTKYIITDEIKSKFLKLLNDNGLSLIKNLMDNNKVIQKEISELEKVKEEITNQLKTFKLSELERNINQLEMLKEKYEKYLVDKGVNDEIEERLLILEEDLKKITEKISLQTIQNAEYNEAILILESEEAMKFNKKIQKEISLLQEENEELNENSEKIIRLQELEKLQNDYKLVEEKKVNNEKLNLEISKIKEDLRDLEEKLSQIREYNITIDIQKAQNETQIEALQNKLNSLNQDFNQKVALQEKLAEHKKLGNIYDIYISMVNASCLPSMILDKHIPVLEKAVNDILTPMTSFQIKITIKGSTIVFRHIKSTGTDITISACSGYEYFMLNLALKMSLAKFGYIPFPSFISIDEGWDVVSESNYSKLQKMFDTLYSIYRNIIVISHLPKVQYMLESYTGTSITIQNVNGISCII
jgi:DNA repair exonuclease SbcCD ATPase subunit